MLRRPLKEQPSRLVAETQEWPREQEYDCKQGNTEHIPQRLAHTFPPDSPLIGFSSSLPHYAFESRMMVTGPSLTRETSMEA